MERYLFLQVMEQMDNYFLQTVREQLDGQMSNLVQGNYTTSALTATTADQVLSSNGVANKAIKYVVMATHSSGTHAAEVLLINNGTNAYFVQYGDAFSASSLFTFNSDVNSGNMRLLVTPANTNTTFTTFQIRLT